MHIPTSKLSYPLRLKNFIEKNTCTTYLPDPKTSPRKLIRLIPKTHLPDPQNSTRIICCSVKRSTNYRLSLAERDFAPYDFMDGFYNDPSTLGSNNQRARLVRTGSNTVLDLLLPKGCATKQCAMQAKSHLPKKISEATLTYKCAPCSIWITL